MRLSVCLSLHDTPNVNIIDKRCVIEHCLYPHLDIFYFHVIKNTNMAAVRTCDMRTINDPFSIRS